MAQTFSLVLIVGALAVRLARGPRETRLGSWRGDFS